MNKSTKLWEVPRNTRVKSVETGLEYNFDHVDGMYSYCTLDDGTVVHLSASMEVTIVGVRNDS